MARVDNHPETETSNEPDRLSEADRKRNFAKAIAKAEFGRFYWNDDLERRLRSAIERPPSPSEPAKRPAGAARKPAVGTD